MAGTVNKSFFYFTLLKDTSADINADSFQILSISLFTKLLYHSKLYILRNLLKQKKLCQRADALFN